MRTSIITCSSGEANDILPTGADAGPRDVGEDDRVVALQLRQRVKGEVARHAFHIELEFLQRIGEAGEVTAAFVVGMLDEENSAPCRGLA